MKTASAKTLAIALFLFTLHANADYILFFVSCGQPFVKSNVVAMIQVGIALASVVIAFAIPRYFWLLCICLFLSYPVSIFLSPWFPDVIFVDKLTGGAEAIPNQSLDEPILLFLMSIFTYLFVWRKENAV